MNEYINRNVLKSGGIKSGLNPLDDKFDYLWDETINEEKNFIDK